MAHNVWLSGCLQSRDIRFHIFYRFFYTLMIWFLGTIVSTKLTKALDLNKSLNCFELNWYTISTLTQMADGNWCLTQCLTECLTWCLTLSLSRGVPITPCPNHAMSRSRYVPLKSHAVSHARNLSRNVPFTQSKPHAIFLSRRKKCPSFSWTITLLLPFFSPKNTALLSVLKVWPVCSHSVSP